MNPAESFIDQAEAELRRILAELKIENKRLKRENSRLRHLIEKRAEKRKPQEVAAKMISISKTA